jgi:hypothetical protein
MIFHNVFFRFSVGRSDYFLLIKPVKPCKGKRVRPVVLLAGYGNCNLVVRKWQIQCCGTLLLGVVAKKATW